MQTRTRMRGVLSLFVFTACTSGCAQTIAFQLVHPARINAAAYGNTFAVADVMAWDEPSARDVAQRVGDQLRAAINADSRNGLRALAAGGGVVITARVTRHRYAEWTSTENFDCSITSRRNALPNHPWWNTVTNSSEFVTRLGTRERTVDEHVSRTCVTSVRYGRVSLAVHFTLTAGTTGETLSAWDVEQSRVQSERARGPGEEPPGIGTDALWDASARAVVARFVRRLTPWSERAEVAFAPCPLFERVCDRAYNLARSGQLRGALDALAPVSERAARINTVPQEQTEGVAAAVHNRALVELMAGDYAAAQHDLDVAIMLHPGTFAWLRAADWVAALHAEQSGADDRDPSDESYDRDPARAQ